MARSLRECGSCGTSWPRATARFCGRCGAVLTDPPGRARGNVLRRWGSWHAWPLGGAVAIVLLGLVGAVIVGVGTVPETPPVASEIELPPSVERPASDAMVRSVAEPQPGSLGCEPEGCARWEAAIGDGYHLAVGEWIVQANPTAVRAVSIETGRTAWRQTWDQDGLPAVLDGVRVQPLGEDRLAILAAGGLLQLRDLDDGRLHWHVDLGVDQLVEVAEHDDLVVVSGWPLRNRQHPPARVAAFHRDDGTMVWEHAALRAVSIQTDPLVIQPRNRELIGLDAASGRSRWEGEVSGPVRALVAEDAVALVTPTGVAFIDVATGEEVARHPRRVSDAGETRVAGALLLIDAPSGQEPGRRSRSTMGVVPIADPAAAAQRYPDTTGVLAAADGGVLLVSQGDTELQLLRLDAFGRTLWERHRILEDERCCWTLQAGGDDDTVHLVPPRPDRAAVAVMQVQDGAEIATFELPALGSRSSVTWAGGIAVLSGPGGTTLAGADGSVRVGRGATVVASEPWPVVDVDGGLVALRLAPETRTTR